MPFDLKSVLTRLLPASLVARVYLLYSATLLMFICIGLGLFYQAQARLSIQDAQDSSNMLIGVVGQVIAAGEAYESKAACLNGIESVKRNATDAPIVEVEH